MEIKSLKLKGKTVTLQINKSEFYALVHACEQELKWSKQHRNEKIVKKHYCNSQQNKTEFEIWERIVCDWEKTLDQLYNFRCTFVE